MSIPIVNKVAESALITIDLGDFFPKEPLTVFDIKPFLFMELILKEKDFREALKNYNWEQYQGQPVTIICSTDAIIPVWAYMLLVTYLQPYAKEIFFGNEEKVKDEILLKNIRRLNITDFIDKRIVVKGCGELAIGEAAYIEITKLLRPIAKSIMYGEPCSTVPIYKKK